MVAKGPGSRAPGTPRDVRSVVGDLVDGPDAVTGLIGVIGDVELPEGLQGIVELGVRLGAMVIPSDFSGPLRPMLEPTQPARYLT